MSQTAAIPVRPRAIAMSLTVLLHLAMLAALIWLGSVSPPPRREAPLVTTLSLPGSAKEAEPPGASLPAAQSPEEPTQAAPAITVPPPFAMPVDALQTFVPDAIDFGALTPEFDTEPDPATTGDAADAASTGPGRGDAGTTCPLVESLRAALEQDVRAQAALALIPRPSRSVANAVMLWDGRWIAPERVGGRRTTDTVRSALATVLSATTQACRTQLNLGPVFVPVSNERETIILAFGSGAWRWEDVLKKAPPYDPAGTPGSQ